MNLHTCEAKLPLQRDGNFVGLVYCDDIATGLYRWGCLHEHIKDLWTCDDHAPTPGAVGCYQCLIQGHECEMAGQLVQLAFDRSPI